MGKKNKKLTKINQKIKHFFHGEPFDVGVELLPTQTLSELIHSLGIYDIDHNKTTLIKALRQLWSEADVALRQDILHFFKADGKLYKPKQKPEPQLQRIEKIEELLEELDVNKEEGTLLFEAFSDVRSKKITIEKMEAKLGHIRFEKKKQMIEKELGGVFDLEDAFEFNASLHYKIYNESFHKILTLTTKPYEYTYLKESEAEQIYKNIIADQKALTAKKQKEIDLFLASLGEEHPYLSKGELLHALRASPPKNLFSYPLLKEKLLSKIISEVFEIQDLEMHEEELLLKKEEHFLFPMSEQEHSYTLEMHIELGSLLETIWKGEKLDFSEVLSFAKEEHEHHFKEELDSLVEQCGAYASLLKLKQEELYALVYKFLNEYLTSRLVITPKIARKTLRAFVRETHTALIKKQREALLARSIRDFKNLFPLARELRRKLTLHIGPTNSGKTYEAMQKLKNADTGYYLAPLRLLALEGYEGLKSEGIDVSLITGEEQLLNEEATHISSTIEMLNFDVDVDVCVIDEVQMIDDRDRGWAWANAIIGAPAKEIIMTGSSNVKEAVVALAEYLGEELEIIEFERKNPLTLLEEPIDVKEVEAQTAIIAFSRKDVLKLKQNFSRFFSVSVIYGNLSPEVRREEARRFREGETQILVATDAIAMGMNLPIKTLLFSKAQKFDGISDRNLYPSEVHQIAGRAGRYGINEEGYVGALSTEVLKIVQKNYVKKDKAVTIPFKVMANLDHIRTVGTILEENSLAEILKFFVENMEFSGPFRATNLDDMMEAAFIVDGYELDLATKYHLACAPLTLKSPYILASYENYILSLEKKESVLYNPPALVGSFAQTSEELLRAEDMVKEISLYLWLSYRFEEYFIDTQKAREYRSVLNRFIEQSLQQSHFVPRCRMCDAPLALNTKYTICQNCFKKNYARKRVHRRS